MIIGAQELRNLLLENLKRCWCFRWSLLHPGRVHDWISSSLCLGLHVLPRLHEIRKADRFTNQVRKTHFFLVIRLYRKYYWSWTHIELNLLNRIPDRLSRIGSLVHHLAGLLLTNGRKTPSSIIKKNTYIRSILDVDDDQTNEGKDWSLQWIEYPKLKKSKPRSWSYRCETSCNWKHILPGSGPWPGRHWSSSAGNCQPFLRFNITWTSWTEPFLSYRTDDWLTSVIDDL